MSLPSFDHENSRLVLPLSTDKSAILSNIEEKNKKTIEELESLLKKRQN